MQFYFIRHAQSTNNAIFERTGAWTGRHHDPPLSSLGERQLPHLAAIFSEGDPDVKTPAEDPGNRRGFGLTHLYSSLMERAIQTAGAIAEVVELPVVAWVDLHERGGIYNYGETVEERLGLPGPGRRELAERFPHLALPEELPEDGWWNRPFEDMAALGERARRFLALLQEKHAGTDDRVGVVSHGGFYQALLRAILGVEPLYPSEAAATALPLWFQINNAAISRIDFHDDHTLVVYLNRIDHLPAGLIT